MAGHLSIQLFAQVPDVAFRHLDLRDGLPDFSEPHALLQDAAGRLWLGTDKGLFQYDGYDLLNFPPNIQDTNSLSELAIQALYLHTDSTIWIGMRNLGISIYHPDGKFSRYFPTEDGGEFPVQRVWDFYRDHQGMVWISSDKGLVKCEPDSMHFTLYQFDGENFSASEKEYLNTLREVSDDPVDHNRLWICTRSGLISFDKKKEVFERHAMPYNSDEVGLAELNFMLIDVEWTSPYDLWLSSWAGGMMHYNTATAEWRRYRNPFADPFYDIGYTLVRKDEDEFWFTNYGMAGTFEFTTGHYTIFRNNAEQSGGLLESLFYRSLLITHDGALVISGSSGLNISTSPVPDPSVHLDIRPFVSSVTLNHQPLSIDGAEGNAYVLHLRGNENTLGFTCTWPSFINTGAVRYRFRLEGYDNQWIDNGQSRKVQYTNLKPGRYIFYVAASNDGKNWITGTNSLPIIVKVPFYRSLWFVMLAIAMLLAVTGFFYSIRIRQIKRESKLKTEFNRQLAENEMIALRAQMNPHFMFNSLNSIKNYILKENTTAASRYLTKFSQLMRAILKNSRHKLISLEDELYALRLYVEMESMRFNNEFEYEIKIDPLINVSAVFIPPLLIQPYVENAIWHGLMLKDGNRILLMQIHLKDDILQIVIEDNGVGRQQSALMKAAGNGQHKSFGMKITKDRIGLINRTLGIQAEVEVEDLADENGNANGTRVIVNVPVINEKTFITMEETE